MAGVGVPSPDQAGLINPQTASGEEAHVQKSRWDFLKRFRRDLSPTTPEMVPNEAEIRSGSQIYEIAGARINLGWEKFDPKEPTIASADEAVVMSLGWGTKIPSKPVEAMTQPFADHSHLPTYAITTEAERLTKDALYKESKAIRQLLQEKGLKKVILAGHSLGGARAVNLAVLLQEEQVLDPGVEVRGLVLMDPVGLYGQGRYGLRMLGKFAADSLARTSATTVGAVGKSALREIWKRKSISKESISKAFTRSWQSNRVPQMLDVGGDALVGMLKDLGQLFDPRSGHIHYIKWILAQAKEAAAQNPRLSQVKVPVIIIHGAEDAVISKRRITPPKVEEQVAARRQEVMRSKQTSEQLLPWEDFRGKFLKENVFTGSPIVKMVLARKAGHHGLPLFRDVARAGLYMLERARRELAGSPRTPTKAIGS